MDVSTLDTPISCQGPAMLLGWSCVFPRCCYAHHCFPDASCNGSGALVLYGAAVSL